ncbi:uncharacterized protein IAS62_005942 [Cryptococcus decagattii]|uniref:Fatty acid hydroxylase domain-containing protein n=1 Tax=Cryptococcus decagattii TaxID=1859122 RepID=A0ABZ2B2C4_9TREE
MYGWPAGVSFGIYYLGKIRADISPPKNPWTGKDHILHHHHYLVHFVVRFEEGLLYTHYRGGRIVTMVGILGGLVWRE